MYIENIVIGNPLVLPKELLSKDDDDWFKNELNKTYFTNERFLPKILVNCNLVKSTSEIRRNRKDLWITLNQLDYMEIKINKKKIFILVGNNEKS